MDPLTITCTVVSLTAKCLNTAKTLHNLKERYQDAAVTITAISTECTMISASLSHVQALVLKNPDVMQNSLRSQPELVEILDTSITGCVLVFSILDGEVQKLVVRPESIGKRVEQLWKDDRMKELLQQIRGQQTALSLLIQALQLEKLDQIRKLLESNRSSLDSIAQRTLSLRKENPTIRSPTSIFHPSAEDSESLFSFNYSFASSTEFDFDDVIVNSAVYRRHLASLKRPLSVVKEGSEEKGASDLVAAEEKYNARLHALTQKCTDFELRLKAAEVGVTRLRANRNEWMNHSQTLKTMHEEVRKKNQVAMDDMLEKYAAAQQTIADKESSLVALRASNDIKKKTEQWINSFEEACENLKRQYNDIVPAAEALRENDRRRLDSVIAKCDLAEQKLHKSRAEVSFLSKRNLELSRDIDITKEELIYVARLLDGERRELQETRQEIEAKDAELGRYKRYDPILEQLRAVSSDTAADSEPNRQQSPKTPIIRTASVSRASTDSREGAIAVQSPTSEARRENLSSPTPTVQTLSKVASNGGGMRKTFQFKRSKQSNATTATSPVQSRPGPVVMNDIVN